VVLSIVLSLPLPLLPILGPIVIEMRIVPVPRGDHVELTWEQLGMDDAVGERFFFSKMDIA
jgi:hypothetical protein